MSKVYQVLAHAFSVMNKISLDTKPYQSEPAASATYELMEERIEHLMEEFMPSGSGCDNGTQFDYCSSKPNKLVLLVGFHHMDDNGMYCGWTEHKVIITPDLRYDTPMIRITGKNKRDIKDYLGELFHHHLTKDICWQPDGTYYCPEDAKVVADYLARVEQGKKTAEGKVGA